MKEENENPTVSKMEIVKLALIAIITILAVIGLEDVLRILARA